MGFEHTIAERIQILLNEALNQADSTLFERARILKEELERGHHSLTVSVQLK